MRSLAMLSLFVFPLACATVEPEASTHSDLMASVRSEATASTRSSVAPGVAAAQFEKIKALAGEWSGKFGEGETADTGETRFRLTAAGSAVEEVLFPGAPHEMVTFYHLDGDRLMLTHYCAAGNQPRMVARSSAADGATDTIRFDYFDATNLASLEVDHMHSAEMTVTPGRLQTQWTFYKGGQPAEVARFDLARKSTP